MVFACLAALGICEVEEEMCTPEAAAVGTEVSRRPYHEDGDVVHSPSGTMNLAANRKPADDVEKSATLSPPTSPTSPSLSDFQSSKCSKEELQSHSQWRPSATLAPADDPLEHLPLCPTLGCSYAFLKQFADSEGSSAERMFDGSGGWPSSRSSDALRAELKRWADSIKRRSRRWRKTGEAPGSSGDKDLPSAGTSSSSSSFNMGTVCNDIVKPRTRVRRDSLTKATTWSTKRTFRDPSPSMRPPEALSYAELGLRLELQDSTGKPAFAKATHFVSHAWKCGFKNFVEALGFWMQQSGTSEHTTYFWVDAFVVNQHQTQEFPQEWWSTRFMQAIGDIGHTVLVVDPWHHPVPLERAWVIWELYCTAKQQAKLHVAMSRNTLEEFKAALLDSFEKVQTAMSYVDVSKSRAFHEHDCAMIHAEIQRTIGFTKMNELVQRRLMEWLLDYVKDQLLDAEGGVIEASEVRAIEASEIDRAAHFRLKENLGRLLRESGRADDAEKLLLQLLVDVEAIFGKDHLTSMSCENQLAVTLQKLGKDEEALRRHRECCERRMRVLGPVHADTLQSTSNLAVFLGGIEDISQQQFDEARRLYLLAISGREASVGPDHPRTLYTLSKFAALLSKVPTLSLDMLNEAEALHARAVAGLVTALHEEHPLALTAMHHQACHWLTFCIFQEKQLSAGRGSDCSWREVERLNEAAYEQLRRVKTLRTAKLGKDHPDTVLTQQVLDTGNFRLRLKKARSAQVPNCDR